MGLLSGFVSFFHKSSYDSACGIMLVKSVTELLSDLFKVLLEVVHFEHQSIPFILENGDQTWNAACIHGTGLYDFVNWKNIRNEF